MNAIAKKIAIALLALLALGAPLVPASQAGAAAAPAWRFDITPIPTNFPPGAKAGGPRLPQYNLLATNVGTAPTKGPVTIVDTLPAGLTLTASAKGAQSQPGTCANAAPTVTCVFPGPVQPGQSIGFDVRFNVDGTGTILHEGDTVIDEATLSGGGTTAVVARHETTISAEDPPFGFVPGTAGFGMTTYADDGTAEQTAGAHPHLLSVNLSFTSSNKARSGASLTPSALDGGVRDVTAFLPRGMAFNPTASAALCTEVQMEGLGCPLASQIGVVDVLTSGLSPLVNVGGIYNMAPTPGKAATFSFEVVGFFIHIEGGLRAGDYAIASETRGIPSLALNPAMATQLLFWGDPSSSSFDYARKNFEGEGMCPTTKGDPCPVPPQDTPLLAMPTSCAEEPIAEGAVDSWGHPGVFSARANVLRDANDNPIGVTDCAGLQFEPTLKARPTTNVADSPSGLEVDLEVPQTNSLSERATAHLQKAVVSLPDGLVLNPGGANGLAGCSSAQAGIDTGSAVPNGNPVACPDASRIGSIEVNSPLVDHPLPGSVFVATPHDNPFDSLLAIYAIIDDPISGTLIKLPGHVVPDPNTGRLVTTFDNNPQLPFSHFKLSFFGGAHGVLRTPSVCGNYSTTSQMTPWSAPDSGPPATPHDDYSISAPPSGGSCAPDQPNSPSLDAGVVSPIAGSYTPFVLHLRRPDGSQQFSSFATKLPPGLTGKLAGTAQCSDAALAAAAAKSGTAEQASPSCPASSHVGEIVAGSGSGPSPYYAHGDAYLAGPYKGAPLS
ncbi:MAG: hypothetical protein ACRDLL_01115, partial [Solirubrobacterales bacterium]